METLFKLAGILSASGSTEAAKLRPALFLAQEWSGVTFYDYKLGQGVVFSDQLDQDLSQLASGGLLIRSDSSAETGITFTPSTHGEKAGGSISGTESRLRDVVVDLLKEPSAVLEAAATSQFFSRHGLGDPQERLQWFRSLPEGARERAKDLIAGAAA
jgi:hypothetical protein